MNEEKTFKNTRTGQIAKQIKVKQSDWDKTSDPEKIKDFYSYQFAPNIDIENGDILIEV
jgi:hypothetical protein